MMLWVTHTSLALDYTITKPSRSGPNSSVTPAQRPKLALANSPMQLLPLTMLGSRAATIQHSHRQLLVEPPQVQSQLSSHLQVQR